jgi:hypothetical protein
MVSQSGETISQSDKLVSCSGVKTNPSAATSKRKEKGKERIFQTVVNPFT